MSTLDLTAQAVFLLECGHTDTHTKSQTQLITLPTAGPPPTWVIHSKHFVCVVNSHKKNRKTDGRRPRCRASVVSLWHRVCRGLIVAAALDTTTYQRNYDFIVVVFISPLYRRPHVQDSTNGKNSNEKSQSNLVKATSPSFTTENKLCNKVPTGCIYPSTIIIPI